MTKYPELKFLIDSKVDSGFALSFLDAPDWMRESHFPPELHYLFESPYSINEQTKIISEYVYKTFKEKTQLIKVGTEKMKNDWHRIAPLFFKLVDEIFEKHPWPRGNYRAYPSVFWMFPRLIDERIFMFPFEHNNPNWPVATCSHEMLHFIFFDYVKKYYGLHEDDEMHGDKQYVWRVSEAFNDVVEEWGAWEKLTQVYDHYKPYPGNEEIYKIIKELWNGKAKPVLDQLFNV